MAGYAAAASLLAPIAAGGALFFAFDSARSAVSGELSAVEVADRHYGTGFSDVYRWQQQSTTARVVLGVVSIGTSEAWYQLNDFVSR